MNEDLTRKNVHVNMCVKKKMPDEVEQMWTYNGNIKYINKIARYAQFAMKTSKNGATTLDPTDVFAQYSYVIFSTHQHSRKPVYMKFMDARVFDKISSK